MVDPAELPVASFPDQPAGGVPAGPETPVLPLETDDDTAGHVATKLEGRLLKQGRSTLLGALGPSLTTKAAAVFVLCAEDGDIDTDLNEGYGLYFNDTRYLDRATLRLCGQQPSVLLSTDQENDRSICELTNPELWLTADDVIPKETLGIRRERRLGDQVEETIQVQNFARRPLEVTLALEFGARFDSMFVVRGSEQGRRGTLFAPQWDGPTLNFRYDGADGRRRTTALTFDPPPDERRAGGATYRPALSPGGSMTVQITIALRDDGPGAPESTPGATRGQEPHFGKVTVETDNPLFDQVLMRSFADLHMLVTRTRGNTYFAAGVPWYVALFGRDSIITALETLAYDPEIAANTLRVLARYQGTTRDDWRDEEWGKILHELRVDEKASLQEVPQTPYYGSIDATPLFIVLLGEYVRWTGDLALWRELREPVRQALQWIDHVADHDGDGFIDYRSRSAKGLANQGWKDSGNSITNRDGSLAEPPIALVEAQGYVYRAKRLTAWLYEQEGDRDRAERLKWRSEELRDRFYRAFWMPDRRYLAVALQRDGRRAESITSNAGQALWSGIVDPEHAAAVADRLLSERMFCGWGTRTLAEGEAAYNPIDYQVGAVWPHDNALIAAGLKRYGRDEQALAVLSGMFEAAIRFPHYRLPELFAGFSRAQYSVPVRYPVACNPQAWSAGAIPYLLQTTLGLHPNALARELRIIRPLLPDWLGSVTLRGLRVGDAAVDLRFERSHGVTLVAVLRREGELRVAIEY